MALMCLGLGIRLCVIDCDAILLVTQAR